MQDYKFIYYELKLISRVRCLRIVYAAVALSSECLRNYNYFVDTKYF